MLEHSVLQNEINQVLSKELFFIGGTIKSGTTWLQLTLDGHPDISCKGEGHLIDYLAHNLERAFTDYTAKIQDKNKTIFQEIDGYPLLKKEHLYFTIVSVICLLLNAQNKDKSPRVIGERTPDNVRHMRHLHEFFPTAKFLHIIRDGRDCAASGWFHNLRVTPDWTRENFDSLSAYAENYAPGWVRQIGMARAFATEHPSQYLEVRYEELHEEPRGVIRQILNFLGVEASDETVELCCQAGSFDRLAGGRERGEEDQSSLFRKGVVGDWRNHFDGEALERFRRHAGDLLRELGYD